VDALVLTAVAEAMELKGMKITEKMQQRAKARLKH